MKPQLNPGTDAHRRGWRAGLVAARVGSTATSILLFAGVGIGNEGKIFDSGSTATEGTIVYIKRPGIYTASLRLQCSAPVAACVSKGTDAAGLVATPSWSVEGVEDFQIENTDGAGNTHGLNLDATIKVSVADIAAGIAAGGLGAEIRFHATAQDGTAPAGVVVATAACDLRRFGPVV